MFKSIILLNADKLTIDAQSALRRCIEVFNHTTRFFIIVEDRYKLLKPINHNIKITIYKGIGHNSWDRAYDNKKMYEWMLKQSK